MSSNSERNEFSTEKKKTLNTLIKIKGNSYNKILLKYGNSFIERHFWVLMHQYHLFQQYLSCSFKRHI